MVRPIVRETIESLQRAVESAGVTAASLKAVLLAGGSSRIPLVADMVRAAMGRPVVTDTHPKHAVALGAARFAAGALATGNTAPTVLSGSILGSHMPMQAPSAAPPPPPAPSRPMAPPPPARPASSAAPTRVDHPAVPSVSPPAKSPTPPARQ
jgi:hypothetical protein